MLNSICEIQKDFRFDSRGTVTRAAIQNPIHAGSRTWILDDPFNDAAPAAFQSFRSPFPLQLLWPVSPGGLVLYNEV